MMKRVGVAKFRDIDGAYILVSAHRRGDPNAIEPCMSFLYDAGWVAAEWEPRHGPIQLWYKTNSNGDGTEEHYFYDRVLNKPGAWSQLAVDQNGLKDAFYRGDYAHIFNVLRQWAKGNEVDSGALEDHHRIVMT